MARTDPPAPYSEMAREELILRDRLAVDRTELANERTFLAYVRTAFAFFVAGASLVHFFHEGYLPVVGLALMPLGAAAFAWGVVRFIRVRRRLNALQ